MISLDRTILILVVYLTIFYNIERVDFGIQNIIDMSSVVYVLTLLAVTAIFLFPILVRLNAVSLLTLWAGFYVLIRLAILPVYPRPLVGGLYTYLTITEVSLSAIAIYLARDVARHVIDFKQAIKNITLSGLSHRILHKNEALEAVQREILRSRRGRYPICAMVIEPDIASVNVALNQTVLEIQKEMMARYATTNMMRLASSLVRRTDLIIDQAVDRDSFVIILPDTEEANAELLGKRFQSLVEDNMGIRIDYGLATFPKDALTFDDLILQADRKIHTDATGPEDGSPTTL